MTRTVRAAAAAALALTAGPHPGPAEPWRAPVAGPVQVVRPFQAPAREYGPGHRGVDLAARTGDPVLAAGRGRVSWAGRVAGRGVVVVAHADGLRTSYEPVGARVRPGASVRAGTVLGTVEGSVDGATHCPRSCLHWGLRRWTTYLDPMSLLDGRAAGPVRLLPLGPGVTAGPRPTGCAGRAWPWSGSGRPGSPRALRARRPGPG